MHIVPLMMKRLKTSEKERSGSHRSVFCLWRSLVAFNKCWPPLESFVLWARGDQSWRDLWLLALQLSIQGISTWSVCDRTGKIFPVLPQYKLPVIAWHPKVVVPTACIDLHGNSGNGKLGYIGLWIPGSPTVSLLPGAV